MKGHNENMTGQNAFAWREGFFWESLISGANLDAPTWIPAGAHHRVDGCGDVFFACGRSVLRSATL
jgi:hypothetical protein